MGIPGSADSWSKTIWFPTVDHGGGIPYKDDDKTWKPAPGRSWPQSKADGSSFSLTQDSEISKGEVASGQLCECPWVAQSDLRLDSVEIWKWPRSDASYPTWWRLRSDGVPGLRHCLWKDLEVVIATKGESTKFLCFKYLVHLRNIQTIFPTWLLNLASWILRIFSANFFLMHKQKNDTLISYTFLSWGVLCLKLLFCAIDKDYKSNSCCLLFTVDCHNLGLFSFDFLGNIT